MGKDEVRRYLQYLRKEKQVSWSNINIAYCALKALNYLQGRPTVV
ncbi:MAG: phage integrase N-terminal SAM-like domain-containing protein [Candidatus Loosdrechtia sp.]